MRYLSLFSGIEAATVAWEPLGWECVAVAEVDKFPSAVLKHHYPDVPNLGDVTQITDADIEALGPIDLVVGGSPCQDLSVAGKRSGLDGQRSGLFHEQIRIFESTRSLCGARYCLWENVPGAFSTNAGRDFDVVVGAMVGAGINVPRGGWKNTGVALGANGLLEWGVLDAKWRGLAQRRKRVFALLDTGDWASRPPILLEPGSLSGNSPPSRESGTVVAALTQNGVGICGADDNQAQAGHLIPEVTHTLRGECFDASEDGTGRGTPIVEDDLQVRRITPLEACRLQGFPDDYLSQVTYRGKAPADGPMYKALGNSMAVPVMRWIGEKIEEAIQ